MTDVSEKAGALSATVKTGEIIHAAEVTDC